MTLNDKKYTLLEAFGIAVAVPAVLALMVVLMFPVTMFCVWASLKMYGWFAIPYLHAPAIAFWPATGLYMLWRVLNATYDSAKTDKDKQQHWSMAFVVPLGNWSVTLLLGYLIHTYLCR